MAVQFNSSGASVKHLIALVFLIIPLALSAADAPELKVSIDFSGGSAKVESIDQAARVIRVTPTKHAGKGWDCWWYFKLDGIKPGETISVDVGPGAIGGGWAHPTRAVYSTDNATWLQTSPAEVTKNRRIYKQKIDADHAWFAWGPVFVLQHAQALVDDMAKKSPHATAFELCKSLDGKSVPGVKITQKGSDPAFGIWVHARQHAWESGGSWVARGFGDWIISDDPRAETLRKKALIYLVPIMDADNAERGSGGKGQEPQDHNRDWSDKPYWPEVRAAQKIILEMHAAGKFDVFMDLHNPGAADKQSYFYVSPKDILSERARTNSANFLRCAQAEITGPLRYLGKTLESGASYDKNWEKISKNWISTHTSKHIVAMTLETAWNVPESTQENYQRVGKELGLAIERYLQEPIRDK
jgi:hypothetical protein